MNSNSNEREETWILKDIIENDRFKNLEWIRICKFGSNDFLLVSDWKIGLHMFKIKNDQHGTTFELIDYKCPYAQEDNCSGLCIIDNFIFLLYNRKRDSNITKFKFDCDTNTLKRIDSFPLDLTNKNTYYCDLKLCSKERHEIGFLERYNSILHIYNYDDRRLMNFDLRFELSKHHFKIPGLRCLEFVDGEYVYITDYTYSYTYNNQERIIGNNKVHVFKIANNQLDYIRNVSNDQFKCPFNICKFFNEKNGSTEMWTVDWTTSCIYTFDHLKCINQENISMKKKKLIDDADNNNKIYVSSVCLYNEELYVTQIFPKKFFPLHKHYISTNKCFVFKLEECDRKPEIEIHKELEKRLVL